MRPLPIGAQALLQGFIDKAGDVFRGGLFFLEVGEIIEVAMIEGLEDLLDLLPQDAKVQHHPSLA